MSLALSKPFGKYDLGERLAVGGMAEVFRARVRGPEGFVKEVCIKRILPHLSDDTEFVGMFVSEARVAAQLHHANIVQIFDFDVVDGRFYIAMELVEGVDLRRIIGRLRARGERLPVGIAVHVATEILKGLNYAHTRRWEGRPLGLVHRDVSPHNVLVSRAGEVKLADFGIAKAASRASSTRTGVVKGKLPYMAPEQTRGGRVDARADLYSTGVVLYELLTGVRPFSGESDAELLAAILQAPVTPVSAHRGGVPEVVEAVVARLMARNPADRFPAAEVAVRELALHAPPDGSIQLSDFLSSLLASPAAVADREATVKLAKETPTPGSENPVVPAGADAETRTRRPDSALAEDDQGLPYAPTALERGVADAEASEPPADESDASTHVGTTTGTTPALAAPARAAGTVGGDGQGRKARRLAYGLVALGAGLLAVAALLLGPSGPVVPVGSTWGSSPSAATAVSAPVGLAGAAVSSAGSPAETPPPRPALSASPTRDVAETGPVSASGGARTERGPEASPGPQSATQGAVADTKTARVASRRGFGTVFVSAVPWGTLRWRGRVVGQTPRTVERVPVGSHVFVVEGPNGQRRRVPVTIRRDGERVERLVRW